MLSAAAPGDVGFIGPLEADMVLSAPLVPAARSETLDPAGVDRVIRADGPATSQALPDSMEYSYPDNTPPTTTGIAEQVWYENGAGPIVDVWGAFDDAEDGCWLTYDAQEVGGADVVLYASVNSHGELDFMPRAPGETYLKIRGTDSGGLYAETTFKVTVIDINEPPEITDFWGGQTSHDDWQFTGRVTDPDSLLEGMVVQLGGVLESYGLTAVVQSDGWFSVIASLPGLQNGAATAQTHDPEGLPSNLATVPVYLG